MPSILPTLLLGGATALGAAVVGMQLFQAAQDEAAIKVEQQKREENQRKIAVAREAQAAAERVAANKKHKFTAAATADPLINAERAEIVQQLQALRGSFELTIPQNLPGVMDLPLLQDGTPKEAALLAALLLWGDCRATLELAWAPIFCAQGVATPGFTSNLFASPDARAIFGDFSFAVRLGFAASTLDEPSAAAISSWLKQLEIAIEPPAPLVSHPVPARALEPSIVARFCQLARSMMTEDCFVGTEVLKTVPREFAPTDAASRALLAAMGLYVAPAEQFTFSYSKNPRKAGRLVQTTAGPVKRVPYGQMFVHARTKNSPLPLPPKTSELVGLCAGSVFVCNFDPSRGFKCHDARLDSAGNFSLTPTPGTIVAEPGTFVMDLTSPAYSAALTTLHARFLVSYRARLLLQRLPSVVGWSFEHCVASVGDPFMLDPDFVQDLKDSEVATLALGAQGGARTSMAYDVLKRTLLSNVLPPPSPQHSAGVSAYAPAAEAAVDWEQQEEQSTAQARIQRKALESEVECFVKDYIQVRLQVFFLTSSPPAPSPCASPWYF